MKIRFYQSEKEPLIPDKSRRSQSSSVSVSCFSWILSALIISGCVGCSLFFMLELADYNQDARGDGDCSEQCNIQLVESIPEGLVFNSSVSHPSTYSAWMKLLGLTESSLELAGMYFTLRGSDVWSDPSDWEGEEIFRQLAAGNRFLISQSPQYCENNVVFSQFRPGQDTEDRSEQTFSW